MNDLAIEIIRRKYVQRQEKLKILKLAGYTQTRIGELAGVKGSSVSCYFKGTINSRKVETVVDQLISELEQSQQSSAVR